MCEFELIIPEDHPIILELFLILFTTDYSKNYSGIMYACLTTNNESSAIVHLCNESPYYLCDNHSIYLVTLNIPVFDLTKNYAHIVMTASLVQQFLL